MVRRDKKILIGGFIKPKKKENNNKKKQRSFELSSVSAESHWVEKSIFIFFFDIWPYTKIRLIHIFIEIYASPFLLVVLFDVMWLLKNIACILMCTRRHILCDLIVQEFSSLDLKAMRKNFRLDFYQKMSRMAKITWKDFYIYWYCYLRIETHMTWCKKYKLFFSRVLHLNLVIWLNFVVVPAFALFSVAFISNYWQIALLLCWIYI